MEICPQSSLNATTTLIDSDITSVQQNQLNQLLAEYEDLFADKPGRTNVIQHEIHLEKERPITLHPYYRKSPLENAFLEEEIQKMLDNGIISHSDSPWFAPVVIARKKNGKFRLCVDYRKLNEITKKDRYPLPRIDELLDSFKNAKYFTIIDLASGFWQVEIHPRDREKIAFITNQGLFHFNVMPSGLTNGPATFQRLMNQIFKEYTRKFIIVYLDDVRNI